ncbi:DUF6896 domain-containing protein [Cellulomonas gilvus]|uniref:DUF6896 domain-containing protein n=1 Tax=Cellulomonas gilvus (strain ATCC 13127 / NRRL B-14078) TaxID=593907 RepID=F8A2V9_CELGA|nr:hypothetical protein [Cellulomonas gilvus]AEI10676.1 hypothetical protein Celgi_0148 [Cellulomonas gilvus ATCC 13127]
MTPELIVSAFVRELRACTQALRVQFVGAWRAEVVEPLMLRPAGGGPGQRSGRLDGVGDFQVHGLGCRVELDSGAIVDFDWDEDMREVFDGWRLQNFAESLGDSGVAASALVDAARRDPCLRETTSGWFTCTSP